MDPLRIAIYAASGFEAALPPGRFDVVGRNAPREELPALAPHVILVATPDFAKALAHAIRLIQDVPAAEVLLACTPDVPPERILEAVRQGVRDVLDLTDPDAVRHALERIWTQQRRFHPRGATEQGKLIVVHSPKGGSGKSAFATSLAFALARRIGAEGRHVVLADLALDSGDLDLFCNVRPAASLVDLARCEAFGPDEVEAVLTPARHGVRLLPAPVNAEDAELVGASSVERVLCILRERFPAVVVDTATGLNELTLRAFELADRVVIVLPLTLPAIRRAQRGLNLWGRLGVKTDHLLFVAWGQRGDVSQTTAQKLLQHRIAYVLPFTPRSVDEAINAGEPLPISEPTGAYAKAIDGIAAALAGGTGQETPKRAGLMGWLRVERRNPDVSPQKA